MKLRTMAIVIALCLATAGGWATEIIAPGVEYNVYHLPHPNVAHVVKMDLSRPELKLRMGFAQNKRNFTSKETTTTIASRYNNPPIQQVHAAVNASFFGGGIDITGAMADGGNYVQLPTNSWETYMFADARWSRIQRSVSSTGVRITYANGTSVTADRFNLARGDNQMVCYTPDWDSSTRTTSTGTEVIVSNVSYPMRPAKAVSGIVTAVRTGSDSVNNAIPAGGMVISAHGTKASALASNVQVGDRIHIRGAISSSIYNSSSMIVTGAGWIVHNGAPYTATWGNWSDSFKGRHPRTLIAWNDDYLYLIAVDGRQSHSVGMSFQEMADFCIGYLNATGAINLDGGGSTTLVADGQLRNSPSGGTQRAVSNTVMIVSENTSSIFPLRDDFSGGGRALPWDDKFTYNEVAPFSPTAPGGNGRVMTVMDPAGGVETTHVGDLADTDYYVEALVYCQYRADVASNGYERYGIYARDNGNNAFTHSMFGGGNAYLLTYDSNNGRVRAGKVINGSIIDFLPSPIYRTSTAWRKMRIEAEGSNIRYFLDDELIADVHDTSFASGYAGIGYHDFFGTKSNMRGTRVDYFEMDSFSPIPSLEISQVKREALGSTVHLDGVVVTGGLTMAAMFYVTDGASSIGVSRNAAVPLMPSVGERVRITGTTAHAPAPYSDELIIIPSQYSVLQGTETVKPLAMANRSTGGSTLGNQPGVADDVTSSPPKMSSGLNNIGSLVTVWGQLTGESFSSFWIDDGSGLNDGGGTGIQIDLSLTTGFKPPGSYYKVTGILRCKTSDDPGALPIRVIWPRSWDDVQAVW